MPNPNPSPSTRFQEGNPGRPVGSRSAETLFREAIKKLAEKNNIQPDDIEIDLIHTIFKQAKGGNLKAMEMYLDRLYGKPKQTIESEITIEASGYDIIKDISTGKIKRDEAYALLDQINENAK